MDEEVVVIMTVGNIYCLSCAALWFISIFFTLETTQLFKGTFSPIEFTL